MPDKIRTIRPNMAFVECNQLSDAPYIQQEWQKAIGGLVFVPDRYWKVLADDKARTANALGAVILGVISSGAEFKGMGVSTIDIYERVGETVHERGLIAINAQPGLEIAQPETTVNRIIEATNEHLAVLCPAYQLPL